MVSHDSNKTLAKMNIMTSVFIILKENMKNLQVSIYRICKQNITIENKWEHFCRKLWQTVTNSHF